MALIDLCMTGLEELRVALFPHEMWRLWRHQRQIHCGALGG